MSWLVPVRWQRSRLVFPIDVPVDAAAQAVVAVTHGMVGGVVVLEMTATADEVTHHVLTDVPKATFATQALRAGVPGIRTETVDLDRPRFTHGVELKLSSYDRPLRTSAGEVSSAALLGTVHDLNRDESVRVQWLLRPAKGVRPVQRPNPATPGNSSASLVELLLGTGRDPVDVTKEAQAKQAFPLLQAIGRVAVRAETRPRRRQLIGRVLGALAANNRPGVKVRYRTVWAPLAADRLNRRMLPWWHWPMLLNSMELAVMSGWPLGAGSVAGLERGHAVTLPVPKSVPSAGSLLADANHTSSKRPIALSAQDRLRHLHVVGPTGSGKSYLLTNLVLQDIAAGHGAVVIDPKGDLVEDILTRVDARAHDRIVVLDPTNDRRPIGMNLLAHTDDTKDVLVESVVSVFHELYRAFWGPRTDDILRAGLRTLVSADDDYSIVDLVSLLTSPKFRRQVLTQQSQTDAALRSFWQWFETLSDGERNQAISPLLNKLRAITMRPRLRNMVGQTGGIQMSEILRTKQVLLVPLNAGLIGRDASQLLGSLLVAQLWQATLQRAGLPARDRHPVMAVVDEVHDFLKLAVDAGEMLAQARGLGLGLTLAHQHMGQLSSEVESAVLANARSRVMFRLGHDDAGKLARELSPHLTAADLQGLQAYEVAIRLTVDGQPQPPTTGLTRDLPPEIVGQSTRLRNQSAQKWGVPISDVIEATKARQHTTPARQIGREQPPPNGTSSGQKGGQS